MTGDKKTVKFRFDGMYRRPSAEFIDRIVNKKGLQRTLKVNAMNVVDDQGKYAIKFSKDARRFLFKGHINKKKVQVLVDSGPEGNFVSKEYCQSNNVEIHKCEKDIVKRGVLRRVQRSFQ